MKTKLLKKIRSQFVVIPDSDGKSSVVFNKKDLTEHRVGHWDPANSVKYILQQIIEDLGMNYLYKGRASRIERRRLKAKYKYHFLKNEKK